jgi:hypothetical protein
MGPNVSMIFENFHGCVPNPFVVVMFCGRLIEERTNQSELGKITALRRP